MKYIERTLVLLAVWQCRNCAAEIDATAFACSPKTGHRKPVQRHDANHR